MLCKRTLMHQPREERAVTSLSQSHIQQRDPRRRETHILGAPARLE
jgi:hypothetical protein